LAVLVSTSGISFSQALAQSEGGSFLAQSDGQVQLVQDKKKRKKTKRKRKKKGSDEEAAPTDGAASAGEAKPAEAASGTSIHAAHEGQDAPYKFQVSLLSDFAINNQTQGEAKTGTANYDLSGRFGYIITPSIIAGMNLTYSEESYKTEDDTNKSSGYLLGLFGDYLFGDVDKDQMVFFVELGFGFGSESSKAGDVETKASSTQFGLGFGLHYFVDSNVALTGQFNYDTGSKKVDGADEPIKFTSMHLMKIGFSLFL
jgi:opacity protein-like surface antigen